MKLVRPLRVRCAAVAARGLSTAVVTAASLLACGVASSGQAARAQASLPVNAGELVVTCHSGYVDNPSTPWYDPAYNPTRPDAFTVALVNTTDPVGQGAPIGSNWLASQFHNEFQPNIPQRWIARNTGEVFGLTLDGAANPNIFVTATTIYGPFPFGPGGSGAVYRLDGTTGNVTVFATLPNGMSGLGQICHVRTTNQFFVSNFDNGLIYRLSSTGTVLGTYDHGLNGRPNESLAPIADTPNTDFTPLSRRVWAVEDFQGRLFYSVWAEDIGCTPGFAVYSPNRPIPNINTVDNEIWSVALDASGAPIASTARREIVLPPLTNNNTGQMPYGPVSSPVADISFGPNGEIFLSERSMLRDTGWGAIPVHVYNPNDAHLSRLLEYTGTSPVWSPTPTNKWQVGRLAQGNNSAGGNAPDCDGNVWSSGDALIHPNPSIYGLQRIPPGGNATTLPFTTSNSYLIDLDMDTSAHDKTTIGEVDIYDPACDCMSITEIDVRCPTDGTNGFPVSFSLTNQSSHVGQYVLLTPVQPTSGTFSPNQIILPQPLAVGDKAIINTTINGLMPGETICFDITLLSSSFEECCSQTLCLTMPECDCFVVVDESIQCDPANPGTYTYSFSYQNLTGAPLYHLVFWAAPPVVVTPNAFDYSSSPIPPLGFATGTVTITGGTPGSVLCMNVSIHDDHFMECCAEEVCITLPECGEPGMDTCHVTKIVHCCPDAAGLPPSGTITLTVCNNGTTPQTYNWSANGLAPTTQCPVQLSPSDFTPSSGSLGPIPPGQCASVQISVNCERLQIGVPITCAGYGITITNPTGPTMLCTGIVQQSDVVVKDTTGGVSDLPANGVLFMPFEVSTSNAAMAGDFQFEIADAPWGEGPPNSTLRLNGQPLGQSVVGSVVVDPASAQAIGVEVSWGVDALGEIVDVYVIGDVDRDGRPDLAATAAVRQIEATQPSCPGDANGDGLVDFRDLNIVLTCFGQTGDVQGDFNNDGLVTFADLNILLSNYNSACP